MDASQLGRMRSVPLEAVLEGLGAARDPKDPKRNWRTPNGRITITGDKFFDHEQAVGGGGAIDLALHLMGRDFKRPRAIDLDEAARWLGATRNVLITAARPHPRAVGPSTDTESMPQLDPTRIARVRWYLTQRRALPQPLVDQTIDRGDLFADARGNAVFRLRDETGREIGFEKRGTQDRPFHAVQGHKGLFFSGSGDTRIAAFVESAIEAMSYRALHPNVLAVSTTGSAVDLPARMGHHLRQRGFRIMAAFNADRAGDRLAERLMEILDGIERDRPRTGKDWNEVLQMRHVPVRAATQDAKTPARSLEYTR